MQYNDLHDIKEAMRFIAEASTMSPKEFGQLYLQKHRHSKKKYHGHK